MRTETGDPSTASVRFTHFQIQMLRPNMTCGIVIIAVKVFRNMTILSFPLFLFTIAPFQRRCKYFFSNKGTLNRYDFSIVSASPSSQSQRKSSILPPSHAAARSGLTGI